MCSTHLLPWLLIGAIAACGTTRSETLPTPSHGDSGVVTLVVTMTLKPEHEQEFLELARATMAKVHASELGTLLYVLTNHPTEAHTYVWIERYRDAAALEAHMQSPHLAEAMPKLGDWLSAPPQALMLGQVLPK